MALIKTINTTYGVQANYHKIRRIELDSETEMITILVSIYVSKEAAEAGAEALWHETVAIKFDEFKWDPREAFYPILKQLATSYLVGAQDSITPGQTVHQPVFEIQDALKA
jgi:hypothetical protein